MKEISLSDVIKNFGISIFYYAVGSSLGVFVGFLLSAINKSFFQRVIQVLVERTTFGEQYVGSYKLWFIINNFFVLFLIVASSVFMMNLVLRKRRPKYFNKFKRFERFEKNRPQVTMFSLYMIPIGALIINGALISLLLTYALTNFGYKQFEATFILLVPHGLSEVLALIFATSIGLAYLEVLKPYILSKKWDEARKIGRELLFSKVTLIVVFFIALLIIFSGYIEGSLITVLSHR